MEGVWSVEEERAQALKLREEERPEHQVQKWENGID